ncbi:MAG: hypothetical protein J0I17_08830 ['Candidatus Kapabacteria' thiocyanatum]|uniref:Lipid A biosynthesis acyltransferase n=1 Tax=Candidatus Kapaibacterium thiocyanatum TaxID=1895771 RepID=A0A1M3KZM3_9BACT|nr:hypothetical protein ['Candidatus Kapabacteria' thiocyanatum]OJX57785.1 MAG: hypothetical protein BGO89_07385 ['Candidatus Kapabacteria' thiocyanatum]
MGSFSDRIVTGGLLALGALSRAASIRRRIGIGRAMGDAMMKLDGRRLNITTTNVERAFPSMASGEIRSIVRESYHNLGITLAELLAIPSMSAGDIRRHMVIPGIEALRARAERREPSVLVSGHYGNWELLAMAGALHADTAFTIVVHPQKNRFADDLLNSYRTKFGNRLVSMSNAARTLVKVLDEGGSVAFLADQHANPQRDAWIPFFGRPTPTYEAPAALALRYGAQMYTAFPVRQADGGYVAPFEAIRMDDIPNDREGVRILTERHVKALEDAVRAHPGMWSWQHRRWREDDV